MVSVVIT